MGLIKTMEELRATYGYLGNKDIEQLDYPFSNSIYFNLKELYMSTFVWNNLPKGLDPRILETQLMEYEEICVFRLPFTDYYVSLPFNTRVKNPYGEPYIVEAYSPHLENKYTLTVNQECVIIRDKKVQYSVDFILQKFAKRLARVDDIIDTNVEQQRFPYIFAVTDKSKKSFTDLLEAIKEKVFPFFVLNKDMDIDKNFKSVKNEVTFKGLEYHDLRTKILNEFLMFAGVPNEQDLKKERMIVSESMQRMGLTNTNYFSRYDERLKGIERLQVVFNVFDDTTVERSSDLIGSLYNNAEETITE